jgi:hypothetical protein
MTVQSFGDPYQAIKAEVRARRGSSAGVVRLQMQGLKKNI